MILCFGKDIKVNIVIIYFFFSVFLFFEVPKKHVSLHQFIRETYPTKFRDVN